MTKSVPFSGSVKVGILGGGQLGKMIIDEVMRYDIHIGVLDPSDEPPAGPYAHACVHGSFRDYDDVMAFGKEYDVLTIEIEDVHTGALRELQKMGKKVYPQPEVIDIFRDKTVQKQFYIDHNIPTSDFTLFNGRPSVPVSFPIVWKSATGGYDGKGVVILRNEDDVQQLPDVPCLLEKMVPIEKEIGVIVHRSTSGEVAVYPPVEMEFHPEANLVELFFAPAELSSNIIAEMEHLAVKLAESTGIVGTLAVELFLTPDGKILVNECAPRVHNSGHLSIEACFTSQFEQHIRAILGMPLGDTALLMPAAMGNVVGEEGYSGPVAYLGTEELLGEGGVYLHLYGKSETRPFRKMGHITCIHPQREVARDRVRSIRQTFKIISAS